jgi:hypothetical protein
LSKGSPTSYYIHMEALEGRSYGWSWFGLVGGICMHLCGGGVLGGKYVSRSQHMVPRNSCSHGQAVPRTTHHTQPCATGNGQRDSHRQRQRRPPPWQCHVGKRQQQHEHHSRTAGYKHSRADGQVWDGRPWSCSSPAPCGGWTWRRKSSQSQTAEATAAARNRHPLWPASVTLQWPCLWEGCSGLLCT